MLHWKLQLHDPGDHQGDQHSSLPPSSTRLLGGTGGGAGPSTPLSLNGGWTLSKVSDSLGNLLVILEKLPVFFKLKIYNPRITKQLSLWPTHPFMCPLAWTSSYQARSRRRGLQRTKLSLLTGNLHLFHALVHPPSIAMWPMAEGTPHAGSRREADPAAQQWMAAGNTGKLARCWPGQYFNVEQILWALALTLILLKTRLDPFYGQINGDGTLGSREQNPLNQSSSPIINQPYHTAPFSHAGLRKLLFW